MIICRIHLSLPNAYKLMCFDRNSNGNKDVKFFLVGLLVTALKEESHFRYLIVLQINLYCKFSANFPQKIYFHSVTDVKVNHINRYSHFAIWTPQWVESLNIFIFLDTWYVIWDRIFNICYMIEWLLCAPWRPTPL